MSRSVLTRSVVLLAAGAALSACGTVTVPAAPHAVDPECARVIASLPDSVADLPRAATTSQSTAAWGSGDQLVVLRCGVTPPGPTTELCQSLTDADGRTVDWIVEDDGSGVLRYTTYGRAPGVDLTVPDDLLGDQPSGAALDLSPVVSTLSQTAECL